jgi:Asp-tRNA(Asn)/Glu-tRNA(Gln) amidotransferase B subunit
MDNTVLIAVIGILAAPIAAVVTWMLNRKQHISNIYAALSESSQSAVETMQLTMGELRTELNHARLKIEELIEENELLRKDLHEYAKAVEELKIQNRQLMSQIHDMRVAYEAHRPADFS